MERQSGIILNAPGLSYDPFYGLNANDSSQTTGATPERLVFNRFSEGSCVCPSECPTTSHQIANVLLGPYPAFNPSHSYAVLVDFGSTPETINFAFGDCGCGDNAGSYDLTLSKCGN